MLSSGMVGCLGPHLETAYAGKIHPTANFSSGLQVNAIQRNLRWPGGRCEVEMELQNTNR